MDEYEIHRRCGLICRATFEEWTTARLFSELGRESMRRLLLQPGERIKALFARCAAPTPRPAGEDENANNVAAQPYRRRGWVDLLIMLRRISNNEAGAGGWWRAPTSKLKG